MPTKPTNDPSISMGLDTLKKTLSVGISAFPKDGNGFWECVKYSDIALYHAKEHGRDQSVMFIEELRKDKEQY